MPADRRHLNASLLPLPAAPCSRAPWVRLGVLLLLAAGLDLAPARAIAAGTQTKLVRPARNVQANAARQALLKQRAAVLGVAPHHTGKLVGGAGTPAPKTIVTKRFLPK